MKYIRTDLEGLTLSDEEANHLWEESYDTWWKHFQQIRKGLPQDFNQAFDERHFHDYILTDIRLKKLKSEKRYYDIELELQRPENNKADHFILLTLQNVTKFHTSLDLRTYFMEWLYCEILLTDSKQWSLEIQFSEGDLYCEFSMLEYKEKIAR